MWNPTRVATVIAIALCTACEKDDITNTTVANTGGSLQVAPIGPTAGAGGLDYDQSGVAGAGAAGSRSTPGGDFNRRESGVGGWRVQVDAGAGRGTR